MEESDFLPGTSHLVSRLRKFFTLASIEERQLRTLVSHSKIRRFAAGEPLVEEGTYDGWLFVLMQGRVKVLAQGAEIGEIDQPGEIFGEMAILEGRARSATVRAITDTTCLVVDAAFVERLPPAQRNALSAVLYNLMAERLAQRLRTTNEALVKARVELAELKRRHEEIQAAHPASPADPS